VFLVRTGGPLCPGLDPEGRRLPIKLDSTSNGEFAPVPLWPANLEANRLAHEAAAENSKRLGYSKRKFLTSACGAASTLVAFNAANATAGRTGGFFDLPNEAALDLQLARAQVGPAKQERHVHSYILGYTSRCEEPLERTFIRLIPWPNCKHTRASD
jgi:hypothetical protein